MAHGMRRDGQRDVVCNWTRACDSWADVVKGSAGKALGSAVFSPIKGGGMLRRSAQQPSPPLHN